MKIRAKFYVSKVTEFGSMAGKSDAREVVLQAVYDEGLKNESENKLFSKYTPSGTLTIAIANADLDNEFQVGNSYYLDFERAK